MSESGRLCWRSQAARAATAACPRANVDYPLAVARVPRGHGVEAVDVNLERHRTRHRRDGAAGLRREPGRRRVDSELPLARDPKVVGSNPTPATTKTRAGFGEIRRSPWCFHPALIRQEIDSLGRGAGGALRPLTRRPGARGHQGDRRRRKALSQLLTWDTGLIGAGLLALPAVLTATCGQGNGNTLLPPPHGAAGVIVALLARVLGAFRARRRPWCARGQKYTPLRPPHGQS